ncbi:MAG: rRNA methyltransferase [Flavobacteriales bacterium]|nr:MAG: rRNA methyltransferase [Flavobacteriales bacterium]
MITSTKNDKIKYLQKLTNKNAFRKREGVFLVEGQQENELALAFEHQPVEFYVCEDIFGQALPQTKVNLVSKEVYAKIAYRGSSEGIIGVYEIRDNRLEDFKVNENCKIIVLESVEKPGNLGAILRSCEAFGIDAILIADAKIDIYNPNVIRSSVGCFFGMNVFSGTNTAIADFLIQNHISIYTTIMSEDAIMMNEIQLPKKTAIVFGTEHSGLSDFWRDKGQNTLIPMCGKIDSLNLSNAVAISCYEMLRQNS